MKQHNNTFSTLNTLYVSIITKQEFEKEFSNFLKLNGESIDKIPLLHLIAI